MMSYRFIAMRKVAIYLIHFVELLYKRQSQKAVLGYLKRMMLLPFGFTRHSTLKLHDCVTSLTFDDNNILISIFN